MDQQELQTKKQFLQRCAALMVMLYFYSKGTDGRASAAGGSLHLMTYLQVIADNLQAHYFNQPAERF